jgi:hypothetical protein
MSLLAGWMDAQPLFAQRQEVDLSGPGWHLWRDKAAKWENDELFASGTELTKIPSNAPSDGWDQLGNQPSMAVSVPGTLEQYLYRRSAVKSEDSHTPGMVGVSWWYRTINLPSGLAGKTVLLDFESTRYRAEVYLNQKLVAYNLVEGTPFTANLTGLVKDGEKVQLAVRITSPGGMWSWQDYYMQRWGKVQVPVSRGFSGVTGAVKLLVLDPAHIDDIYVQNTPAMHDVNVQVTIHNDGSAPLQGDLHLEVKEKLGSAKALSVKDIKEVTLPPGESVQTAKISAPEAKLWDLDHPTLYRCEAVLRSGGKAVDSLSQTFGFRWFAPEGIGQNAVFRLNGKRIVLRTAISWGLWGTTGLIPSPELAERQIAKAKAYGLNMLNFHRAIGQNLVFNKADEMGLLYYEEPGSYVCGGKDAFSELLMREKLLRMVKRDRSHPSLVIYNLINEITMDTFKGEQDKVFANFKADMAAAHAVDPSRVIVLASAWARIRVEDKVKLNMMPFDDQQYLTGWYDYHRAGGPQCWQQDFYLSPQKLYGFVADEKEIVFRGEEGAISSPPRLELIKKEVEALPAPGWDGEIYLDWFKQFDDFLNRKHLRTVFNTVDDLCVALGAVSVEHQGRKIEDHRICNDNDGYAVNGWEAEPYENHSGVVDCFRYPKSDPKILAYYNQPLYVAVKTRNQVVPSGDKVVVDYYLINEKEVKGPHTLKVSALDAAGKEVFSKDIPVNVSGGETYGQLLTEQVAIPTSTAAGMWTLKARLANAGGQEVATGRDQILVVDWKNSNLKGRGAVYEEGTVVHDFLKSRLGLEVPAYSKDLGPLDWIVVARAVNNEPSPIESKALLTPDGSKPGLKATFYSGNKFTGKLSERVDPSVDFSWMEGASVDEGVPVGSKFCVRWEGKVVPPRTGAYIFSVAADQKNATLKIDGKEVHDQLVDLTANVPVSISLDYISTPKKNTVTLGWVVPSEKKEDSAELIGRAKKDGTTVIIADHAGAWLDAVKAASPITCQGTFKIASKWLGGQYFAIDHPLFKDLPANQALNWPYQTVISRDGSRYGLQIDGEELVAGCWQSFPMSLGTAVGIIPSGKGQIILSTLDICPHLGDPRGPADVARKLLCNYISYANK